MCMSRGCVRRHVAAMTHICYFLPAMSRVILVVFEGVQTLDVTGPAEVFAAAHRQAPETATYDVIVASRGGRTVTTTSGITIETRDLLRIKPRATDTILVAGGEESAVTAAVSDVALGRWLVRAARVATRTGSVCSGAFVLAATGVLDGLRVATHWSACDRLTTFRPGLAVDRDAIFVQQGHLWTSAGVTTGIDMALAMVEADHGQALADAVAARLVLYARRPGFQSQFSDALVAQTRASDPLGPAIAWARAHLRDAEVTSMARHAGMSVRTFHRRCADVLGTTPAKLVERLRVEHARTLLATADVPAKTLAAVCGFGSPVRMNRAFQRTLGVGPRDVRLLFGRA